MKKGVHGANTDLGVSIIEEINLLKRLRDSAEPIPGMTDKYGARVYKMLNAEIKALERDLDWLDKMAARHRKFDMALAKANSEV